MNQGNEGLPLDAKRGGLTRIRATNFNGLTIDDEITSDTVLLLGPNGSGKSSRVQAIQLALAGAIPGEAKSDPEIFHRHATDRTQPMEVEVCVSGKRVNCTWTPKGESVSTSVTIDKVKMSKAAARGALAMALGNQVCFDLPAWLSLSDANKVQQLLEFTAGADADSAAFEANCVRLGRIKAEATRLRALKDQDDALLARQLQTVGGMARPTETLLEVTAAIEATKQRLAEGRKAHLEATRMAQSYKTRRDNIDRLTRELAKPADATVTQAHIDAAERIRDDAQAACMAKEKEHDQIVGKLQKETTRKAAVEAAFKAIRDELCPSCTAKIESILTAAGEKLGRGRKVKSDDAQAIAELEAKQGQAQEALESIRAKFASQAGKREGLQSQLDAALETEKTAPAVPDVEALAQVVKGAEAELETLEEKKSKLDSVSSAEKSVAEVRGRVDQYAKALEVNKAAQADLATARGALLSKTIGPLRETMRGVVGEEIRLDVSEDGKGMDFGVQRGDLFIPHTSLSGGERVMFYGALTVALLSHSVTTIKIAAIEAAEADGVNLRALLDRLSALGSVGIFVMTCADDITSWLPTMGEIAAWQVIDLTDAAGGDSHENLE